MPKSPSVKSLIKDLAPDELREVIAELCKLYPKNRQFLELHILSSNEANVEAITKGSKKEDLFTSLWKFNVCKNRPSGCP